MECRLRVITTAVFSWLALACSAQANLISDSSFEGFTVAPNGNASYAQRFGTGFTDIPTEWTVESGVVDVFDQDIPGFSSTGRTPTPFGTQFLELNGTSPGTVMQSFGTTTDQIYRLSFWAVGAPQTQAVNDASISVSTSALSTSILSVPTNEWTEYSFDFIADSATSVLRFSAGGGTFAGVSIDNVSVIAVPEPASIALGSLGLCGLILIRPGRRRRA